MGEEAVETVIEALQSNRKKFLEESADLFYHYLVLAAEMGVQLKDVEAVLKARHAG
ncbi:MAG: phosphoribosyl-ATP diphosphatase [Flavobacteriales bacterium]